MSVMRWLAERLTILIAEAGYHGREPVIAGVHRRGFAPAFATQGEIGSGKPLGPDTLAYAASLSKQITAACAALLVREGILDMEATLARWLPELPAWAATVRLRHLVYHTGAMPDREVDAIVGKTADRTTPAVLSALVRIAALASQPGTAYVYSGAGYVCLAAVVERAAGQLLASFASQRIFAPLGMRRTLYWPGAAPAPAGAAPLGAPHPAPLSLGDGGVWSTASDLLRWSQALNADELGVSRLLQAPGCLDDGTPIDYAWGMGIRSHAGYRVYRHGGGWPGLRALLARVPDLDLSLVISALADNSERRVNLAASMLDLLTAVRPE
jgi:CubicO group peptidase (beta-lactamase class C family)